MSAGHGSSPSGAAIKVACQATRTAVELKLDAMISLPSIVGAATALPAVIAGWLREEAMTVELITTDPADLAGDSHWSPLERDGAATNIVASWAAGPASTVLFAHLDTEPLRDGDRWTSDPFVAKRVGRRLTGLGAADDKAGVASVLGAVAALGRLGVRPQGLRVAFVHAKGGGAAGTLPVWRRLVTDGLASDAVAIYCHPAETGRGLADLKTGSRGLVTVRIAIEGRVPAPVEQRTPASADPRFGHNAAEIAGQIASDVHAWARDAAPQGTTATITRIEAAGHAPFAVPDRSVLEVGIWFERTSSAEIEASLARFVLARTRQDPWLRMHPPSLRRIGLRADPARSDGRSRLVRMARRSIEAAGGPPPKPYAGHAASDIRFPILCAGIPAVGFGARGGGFYGPDEWVDLAAVHRTTEALVRCVLQLDRSAR